MNTVLAEPLRPATVQEIEQLVLAYEKYLPESIQYVLVLQNALRMQTTVRGTDLQELSHRFRKTIYVLNRTNPMRYATFLAISMDEDLQVVVNTLEQPPLELENVIRNTSYIKWHRAPLFVIGGRNGIQESLRNIVLERNLNVEVISDCINYWMPREKAATITYSVPDDVDLKPLQVEHGKIINDWWPYRYKTSQIFFESAIRHNGGLGLFDKTNGQLVACVFKNDHDGLGHLYTVPEQNNRGYGSTLAKAMTRLLAVEHNIHAHIFITRTNSRSMRLFEKIGYKPVNFTQWHQISSNIASISS